MSNPPRMRAPVAVDPPVAEGKGAQLPRLPLAQRLPQMSDERLQTLQQSATRISSDAEHPKRARATIALPLIDAEIARRVADLAKGEFRRSPDAGRADD